MISRSTTVFLVLSLGLLGNTIFLLGITNYLKPYLLPLGAIFTLFTVAYYAQKARQPRQKPLTGPEKLIMYLLIAQVALNALGLIAPDVSFDAVWYHLPLAQIYAATGRIARVPELTYSTMPRLADMFFIPGFLLSSHFLVRLTSYLISLLYLAVSYVLARTFLPRLRSLLVTAILASQLVFAWQATTGYIDIHRGVFEAAALLALILFRRHHHLSWLIIAAVFTGFALSTKILAVTGFAAAAALIIASHIDKRPPSTWLKHLKKNYKSLLLHLGLFIIIALAVASPWYYANYLQAGHPLYPITQTSTQTRAFAADGSNSPVNWFIARTLRLPLLIWDLTYHNAGFLTPVILILLPILLWQIRKTITHHLPELTYIVIFLLGWWYIPPSRARYMLGLTPALITLLVWALTQVPPKHRPLKTIAYAFIFIAIFLNFAIRLAASARYLPLLTGDITKQEYIKSQTTDFNRDIMEKLYSGNWQEYQYPVK